MTQLAIANEDVATLETAPTHYVEGHGIRFAYRRLGPSTGTPLILRKHPLWTAGVPGCAWSANHPCERQASPVNGGTRSDGSFFPLS